jgi:hypothetical protein
MNMKSRGRYNLLYGLSTWYTKAEFSDGMFVLIWTYCKLSLMVRVLSGFASRDKICSREYFPF